MTLATDAVGPVITNVRFDGINTLYATFSESISGTLTPSSFVLSGTTTTISSVSIPTGSNSGTLTLNSVNITYGNSELSFAINSVNDLGNNKQPSTLFTKISASAILSEVMWSGTGANTYQYVELHNISNVPLSIAGWKMRNAGPDIILSGSIPANGYYLITQSNPTTSPLNVTTVTPDIITGSLLIATGSTLQLLDGASIILDQALISGNIGNTNTPSSMERRSTPGNGAQDASWYTAQTGGNFFDTVSPLGTPKSANIFDATAPTITSFSPVNNTLFPLGNITLSYNYSDSGGIAATPTHTFKLEKNNGAGVFSDVTATSLSSSGINASASNFLTNTLAYGNYRASFSINDAAGNTTQQISNFYVDAPTMTISTGSSAIGKLTTNTITFGTGEITITIHTIGAGFQLSLGGSGTLDAGLSQITAYNGTTGYGIDYASSGSGTLKSYNGTLTAIPGTILENFATGSYIGGNGNLHTFIYTIKHGAKITATQAAGNYTTNTPVNLSLTY